jgi:hypothetical protein
MKNLNQIKSEIQKIELENKVERYATFAYIGLISLLGGIFYLCFFTDLLTYNKF